MKTRNSWWTLTVSAGVATLLLATAISSCVTDNVGTVPCATGAVCPPNWMCTAPCDPGEGTIPENPTPEECAIYRGLGCYVAGCGGACYPAGCGDGRLDRASGELCDDNNAVSGDGCSATCLILESCGNGKLDPGELCDDGNTRAGDGCSKDCQTPEECGDGVIDPEEQCDHGVDGVPKDTADCNANCQVPWCGDSHPNPLFINPDTGRPEACDEGMSTATCDEDCTKPACGDGFLNPNAPVAGTSHTEECDSGTSVDSATCNADCTLVRCGDAHINSAAGEECESESAPGQDTRECDADCTRPACGDGHKNGALAEECDDGNDNIFDACPSGAAPEGDTRVRCKVAGCGDGFTHVGIELCDDGNKATDDACPDGPGATCQPARCGDGFTRADIEQCDGSGLDIAGCDSDCSFVVCGDGHRNIAAGEDCDDGNIDTDDACPSGEPGRCKIARCGDGFLRLGVEVCDDGDDDLRDNCPSGPMGTCQPARCGDGLVHNGVEQCDTGTDSGICNHGDTRSGGNNVNCKPSICGDGYVNRADGEACERDEDCGQAPAECIQGTGTDRDCKCSGT